MKNIFLTFVLLTTTFSTQSQNIEPPTDFDENSPVFEFEKEVINYGKIEKNTDGNKIFMFKNVGKTPLIISDVKGSCGCTIPTKPEKPIMPGETGEIKVRYATNRIGRFSKTVTITSNASEPKKVIRIKGEVLDPKTK